jgi:hypothetical protein
MPLLILKNFHRGTASAEVRRGIQQNSRMQRVDKHQHVKPAPCARQSSTTSTTLTTSPPDWVPSDVLHPH